MSAGALIDTNILVYPYNNRFPEKQDIADGLLRRGTAEDSMQLLHQAIIEFVVVATIRRHGPTPKLTCASPT
jgi:hypothetical protein